MAGLYIHIPFCKQRCTYCDFYTQVAPKLIPDLVISLAEELKMRRNYLRNDVIETIYFGGGTPSLLTAKQFRSVFDSLYLNYTVSENAEITFEANPDDINEDFLNEISDLPFNRISMGIQSFNDVDLKRVNRRHSAQQAVNAVKVAQLAGFKNISIDLIYGLPGQSIEGWEEQIDKAFGLDVQHISVYGLTYEEGTKLWKQKEAGELSVTEDEIMLEMYHSLLKKMDKNGFEAYEISNFAKPGFRSKHNSAYWKLTPYSGIGPSAHSFDGDSRQWNVASTTKYINAIQQNTNFFEKENLTIEEKYNDYVMISLRTRQGIDLEFLDLNFGTYFLNHCLKNADNHIKMQNLVRENKKLFLSLKGIDISNLIIRDLIYVD